MKPPTLEVADRAVPLNSRLTPFNPSHVGSVAVSACTRPELRLEPKIEAMPPATAEGCGE